MNVKMRKYNHLKDFERVGNFLIETYQSDWKYRNWLQPQWEYMHYHSHLNESELHRIGIWEDSGRIVGVVTYELDGLGYVYFAIHPDYAYLKSEMLEYAESNLYGKLRTGRNGTVAFINDLDDEFKAIAISKGFEKIEEYPEYRYESQFCITDIIPEVVLPEGYRIKSLQEDNDLYKVNRVLWRGFDHTGEAPEEYVESRKRMQAAPNYRKDLNIVVEAPNGEFVAYCGMWYVPSNRVAYVEPAATDPQYRRMGLGKAAVLEGIRRCADLGATVVIVGSGLKFYEDIGFRRTFACYPWRKYLD